MESIEDAKFSLEALAKRASKYLEDDLGLELENTDLFIEEVDVFNLESYTALINLKHEMSGTIGFSVSINLARFMVGQFVFGDVSDEEVEEMAGDCVAEILNVVLGNVLKDFPAVKDGKQVDISTPYIMNKTSKISKTNAGTMLVCRFKTNHGKVILTYFIN
jgi:CheY-specific phosphatase CheX